MNHTPTPWEKVDGELDLSLTDRSDYSVITCREIRSQDNDTIVFVVTDTGQEDGEEAGKANYDYVFQAVNSHQAMKDVLIKLSIYAELVKNDITEQDTGWYYQFQAAIQEAGKILTLANGGRVEDTTQGLINQVRHLHD